MTIVFNYTCTSCDVSVYLNMLLLYNWQQLYVSVHIANETVHRRGGKPFSLRPSPLQCSVGPGAMARWTCYVQSRQLYDEVGSPNVDYIALACRMLFCLPMSTGKSGTGHST